MTQNTFLLISAASLLAMLGALIYRWKRPDVGKNRIKIKKMKRDHLEMSLRNCRAAITWEPEWPELLEVYLVFNDLPVHLKKGPAALRSLVKKRYGLDQRTSIDIGKRFFENVLPVMIKQLGRE
jgi:hypothetical protein